MRAIMVVSWLTLVCAGSCARSGVRRASSANAIVIIKSNVRDAQLYVDGRFIAPLDALRGGVAVEPGVHRFELRHEDFYSSYVELRLARAERKNVAMEMAGILP